MENGYVKSVEIGAAGLIEFFHPKGNSLPGNLLEQLTGKINEFCSAENVKALLLTSAGEKTFCAGASFDELLAIKSEDEAIRFFSGFANVINAMRKCPKFIVAKVQGKAVGGGVGIIAAADYVFASVNASVRLSELTIGIAPFVIAAAVERKIGKSAFAEMTIDAEWKTAEWALEKGLYNKIYETQNELDEETKMFMGKLIKYSGEATKKIKEIFWENTENWDELLHERAKLSGKLVLGSEAREFLEKFKSK